DGIRGGHVTGVQTCALPIFEDAAPPPPQGKRQAVNGSIIAGMGLVALIALWIFAVRVLRVPPYILPAPEAVLNALWSGLAVNPRSEERRVGTGRRSRA